MSFRFFISALTWDRNGLWAYITNSP